MTAEWKVVKSGQSLYDPLYDRQNIWPELPGSIMARKLSKLGLIGFHCVAFGLRQGRERGEGEENTCVLSANTIFLFYRFQNPGHFPYLTWDPLEMLEQRLRIPVTRYNFGKQGVKVKFPWVQSRQNERALKALSKGSLSFILSSFLFQESP